MHFFIRFLRNDEGSMNKKYALCLCLMGIGELQSALSEHQYAIPLEIQQFIFFSFLSQKKQLSCISLVSSTFNNFFKKSLIYQSFFKKNVISDIKGCLFNIEMAQINEQYEVLYKKYFPRYVTPKNIDFTYENEKIAKVISFRIQEKINRKAEGTKVLQLFEVIINKNNIGNILVLKEPPWHNYYLNDFEKIKNEYDNIKRIIFKESWYEKKFKSIYKYIMNIGFPLKHVQLPGIKFQHKAPHIIKKNQNIKNIFLPGNMFAHEISLCNDVRFRPASICSLFYITPQNEDVVFPYFITHNFSFELLLEVIKSNNILWLQKLQKKYDLNINMLSSKGRTLMEEVLPDRNLLNIILENGGNINKVSIFNKTIFDKVILKLIDKNYKETRMPYYESYMFLYLRGARQCCTDTKQLEKAEKQLKKYYFQNYEDILA